MLLSFVVLALFFFRSGQGFSQHTQASQALSSVLGSEFAYKTSSPHLHPKPLDTFKHFYQESSWIIQEDDWIYVDVKHNTLQFVRADGSETSRLFAVASGQNLPDGQKIRYIGKTYNPKTPTGDWYIASKHHFNWFSVFGSTEKLKEKPVIEQLFLRLYHYQHGKLIRTSYGVHTVPEIRKNLIKDEGYITWGCVVTNYSLLKQIEELYDLKKAPLLVRIRRERYQKQDFIQTSIAYAEERV